MRDVSCRWVPLARSSRGVVDVPTTNHLPDSRP